MLEAGKKRTVSVAQVKGMIHMLNNDFRSPVTVDDAPAGSRCEWCGKPAVYQLLATGGKYHNQEGCFCATCGEEFVRAVADSLSRVITAETSHDCVSL
jgi:hypothetical protein